MNTKRCPKCKVVKDVGGFGKASRRYDGLQGWCKSCRLQYGSLPKIKAQQSWKSVNERCLNADGHHPTYTNTECKLTKEEFVSWYIPAYEAALIEYGSDIQLSIDRIDDLGHYEIGNIRIIPLSENSRRKKYNKNVHAPAGTVWCYRCKDYFPKDQFYHKEDRCAKRCIKCDKDIGKSRKAARRNTEKNNISSEN